MACEAGAGMDPEVLVGAAEARMRMDRFLDAAGFYATAYQSDSDDSSLLARASVAFAKGGDITNAAKFAESYTMKNPNDMTALSYLAAYYDKLGRKEDAARIRNVLYRMKQNPSSGKQE
jgi:Flp pilus assembly protein TadD